MRLRFNLTSDQLELLLAFEKSEGLNQLAETMAKDSSVISRNLQRIAENYPVLKKVKGRWEITPLGIQVNEQTRMYLEKHTQLLSVSTQNKNQKNYFNDDSILIIINAQNGLLDATQEGRNNSEAEKNILNILELWRTKKRSVIHVKHVSDDPNSNFFKNSVSCDFLNSLAPKNNEDVVEKEKSSAFAGTSLENLLNQKKTSNIILVGFTANECIDATARDAAAFGFETFVIGDATATFDIRDPYGKLVKAERIHKLTLANINAFYAKVIMTSDSIFQSV
jgi:nicotinamidase-related amidase